MIRKCLHNPMFWIGANIVAILNLISDFIEGDNSLLYTASWGVAYIILTAINVNAFNKQGEL